MNPDKDVSELLEHKVGAEVKLTKKQLNRSQILLEEHEKVFEFWDTSQLDCHITSGVRIFLNATGFV